MTATVQDPLYAGASKGNPTTFDLEPNPFEQSFASKDASKASSSVGSTHQTSVSLAQQPRTHDQNTQQTTGATSPNVYTPGGRRLPPLVLSPNAPSSWNTSAFPRTGLTPNESGMRSGLTPGGNNQNNAAAFAQGLNLPGLATPGGGIGFTGFTPGLSSLLGTTTTNENQPLSQLPQATVPNEAVGQTAQKQISAADLTQGNDMNKTQGKRGRKKGSTSAKKDEQPRKKSKTKETSISARKSKSISEKASPTNDNDNDHNNNEDDLPEDEKRKNFLERNRVAASKCRQRKKQQQQKMEQDLNFYLNEYNDLTSTIDQLKEHSLALRALLINDKATNKPDIMGAMDNMLNIINQTNYVSRLRGDNPNHIIPTVQPINPALVQQNQNAVVHAQLQAQAQAHAQVQVQTQAHAQLGGSNILPVGVVPVPMTMIGQQAPQQVPLQQLMGSDTKTERTF